MIRCVLAATDGSEPALDAVRFAADLAKSLGPDARLHVAAVVNYIEVPGMLGKRPEGAPDLLSEEAREALDQARAAVEEAGMTAEFHSLHGDVVDALLECARNVGADILAAGYRGRNRLASLVMGSAAGRLVRSTTLPVAIVRHQD